MADQVRTALIRIEKQAGGGHPISLAIDAGDDAWDPKPEAKGILKLPSELAVALPGADGGDPLEVARRVVLERSDQSDDFRKVGAWLHEALVSNDAGARWREERAKAGAEGLRTLLDIAPDELARLPWELLWNPDRPLGAFADTIGPLARVRRFDPGRKDPDEWWPMLRVMVIVALNDADAAVELAGLHDGFARVCGLVELDVVRRPSETRLRRRFLELRPHVVHYIGHGQPGVLDFPRPDDAQKGWRWDTASIAALLQEWQPRVAVVSACRSGTLTTTLEEQRGVFGVADTLSDAGVPAVVTMQADVKEAAAAAFSVELWSQIGRGVAVDVAAASARSAMKTAVDSWARRDPWLPSLTVSVLPEKVLPRLYPLAAARRKVLRGTPAWETVHHFIDRGDQRRAIWREIVEAAEEERHDGVLVLGPQDIGKTSVAQWCVGACSLRGHDAAYVDLEHRPHNVLGLLGAIADELARGAGNDPNVIGPLDAYVARVDELQANAPFAGAGPAPPGSYQRVQEDISIEMFDQIFAVFRQTLAQIAGESRLLVALDHVPVPADTYWEYVVDGLLSRLDEARTICVVTADDEVDAVRILGRDLERRFRTVKLPMVPRDDLTELLGQLLSAHHFRRQDVAWFVKSYAGAVPAESSGVRGTWFRTAVALAADTYEPEPAPP